MFSLLTKRKDSERLSVWSVCEVTPEVGGPRACQLLQGDSVSRLSHPLLSVLVGRGRKDRDGCLSSGEVWGSAWL